MNDFDVEDRDARPSMLSAAGMVGGSALRYALEHLAASKS